MIEENYTKERKIPMSDCIFCKIIAGEIPSATIYENDEFKVILDRFPSGEGHALILPKTMCNVFEIDLHRQAEHTHWRQSWQEP